MATQNCVFSGSKRISKKNTVSFIIPTKPSQKINIQKLKKLMFFLIVGSIIGPAMAGPTGPFATALQQKVSQRFLVNRGVLYDILKV